MFKTFTTIICSMILFGTSNAQNQDPNVTFQGKYHMLDSAELFLPKIPNKAFVTTPPPVGTIRAVAEWEPMQAVLVSYPGNFGIPYTLIAEMSQDINVITIVESAGQQATVTINYNSNGVNTLNCSFIIAPLDTYWTRDYGPWFIMVNNSEIGIIDFPYNRPTRIYDDNVPGVMASYLGEDMYGMNVSHTGGNYMCDGMGIAAMTNLVEDENSLTHAQIDTLFKQYMGISKNYITTDPLDDYIKHIDCWSKFLDVDKIVIAQVPVTDYRYPDYEAMATYWANEISSYGNHYQVYRVYEPNGQPYSNSLILNKKVFLPFVSGTGSSQNAAALAVYQQAMPGYEIFGITYSGWQSTDALHCRAHEIADKNMLYIQHLPLLGQQADISQYDINANIYALSGNTIISDSVWIKYNVNNGVWNQVSMTNPTGNLWTAAIPQQLPGDTVEYYIHAADQTPRSVSHPIIGAYDPHKFYISGSVAIKENEELPAIIFPNPANEYFFVQMKDCTSPFVNLKILDATGRVVLDFEMPNNYNNMIKVDVSNIVSGTYFLELRAGETFMSKKMMVMH